MGNMAMNWVVNHHEFLLGIAAGWAAANIPVLVGFVFDQAMKVPYLRSLVLRNPAKIKAYIKEIEDALEKEIDEEVENSKKETPAP